MYSTTAVFSSVNDPLGRELTRSADFLDVRTAVLSFSLLVSIEEGDIHPALLALLVVPTDFIKE